MKFSDYFFAPGVRPLSVITGVVIGGLTAILAGWQLGVFVGAIVVLLTALTLPVIACLQDLPYQKIKKTLKHPFLLDERVLFTVQNRSVGGYFILTESSMVLLSLEKGTQHRLELAKGDVKAIKLEDGDAISIFVSNTKFVRILSAASEELFSVLTANGWGD
jgi:hypothetical protein